jgi:hypothetical protein
MSFIVVAEHPVQEILSSGCPRYHVLALRISSFLSVLVAMTSHITCLTLLLQEKEVLSVQSKPSLCLSCPFSWTF